MTGCIGARRIGALAVFFTALPALAATPLLKEIEAAFVRIGEDVRPSVVNIDVETEGPSGDESERMQEFEELFRYFGTPTPELPMPPHPSAASGSGFIYDTNGHIVTNDHVIRGATSIKVRLWNGESYDAVLVGSDPDTDVAVIKIESKGDLRPALIGDSNALQIGQFAIAIGSPRGLEGSFSFGHVTGLSRQGLRLPEDLRFQDFIQTDAAINLGNSGGPLCDIDGRVIGINTAIVYGADSLGFAVPINMAAEVIPKLISDGKISRGFLGVDIADVERAVDYNPQNISVEELLEALQLPDKNGAYVREVHPGSPAEAGSIKRDDVIRKVNGQEVMSAADLQRKISAISPGSTADIEVWRNGKPVQVQVQLVEYAGSPMLARAGAPILGMRFREVTPDMAKRLGLAEGESGLLVIDVEEGSVAALGEISVGDIITRIAEEDVTSIEGFRTFVDENCTPGKSLFLRVTSPGGQSVPKVIRIPEVETPQ